MNRIFQNQSISKIGLGTWQLGSSDWGNVSEQEAFNILETFVAQGGNFIDTADVYGGGVSEQVIGKFLKTQSKPLFVATKLGRRSDGDFGWNQNFTYPFMRRQVEESLKNLQLEQVFLEQLHCIPTEVMRQGEVFEHLRKLKSEGLIQHFGASVETIEEAQICLEQEGLASLQIIFNIFRQHSAQAFFDLAQQKNVALIVRLPLASGLLSGKFSQNTTFTSSDHRHYNANGEAFNVGETFSGIAFEKGVALAKEVASLLPDDRTAQWAIRWILDHPAVTTVIPGATKISQVITNGEAASLPPLSSAIHQNLAVLYEEKIRKEIRGGV